MDIALLPLDALAAILIWRKPKVGAWLGLAIMVSDVTVNSWIIFNADYASMSSALLLQSAFLLFVLATFRHVSKAGNWTLFG